MDKGITIPIELITSDLWNNDKPYSEAQAYIQFMVWADSMGGETKFLNGTMVTLKDSEFIMSQRKIAESINWTQSAVNRFLKKLVTMNQCCINNESRMTRISLLVKPLEPETTMTQEVIEDSSLYDSFFGGRTDSTNSSNNYNIINNSTSNNNNTNTNNNILQKDAKKPSTSRVSRSKSVSYTAKPKDLDMVIDYFKEKDIPMSEAKTFYNYYEMTGWFSGKAKIKNWRMAAANWKRRMKDQPKAKEQQEFKVATSGDYLVYCHNVKCRNYATSCFAKNTWDIKKGCTCGHDWHNTRAKSIIKPLSKPKEDIYAKREETRERQERPKESSARSGTSTGDSESLQDILGKLF